MKEPTTIHYYILLTNYRLSIASIVRPVYFAISSAGMPSAFILRAFSQLACAMPCAMPCSKPCL